MLVERVDGVREQREQQAERAGEDERTEQVEGLRPARDPAVEDGPPDEAAGGEVGGVLGVEDRPLVAKRGVVRPRQVPGEVGDEPDGQRDERLGQRAHAREPLELRCHARG